MAMAQTRSGSHRTILAAGKREVQPHKLLPRLTAALTAIALVIVPAEQVSAQQQINLIRDVETEALIAEYTAPIFRAANVSSHNIKVHLIDDKSFNAFVINGQNMFINTGAILQSETPNQLIGVIAHETGHIKGSHNAKMQQLMEKMQTAALLLQVLSIGAVVGGAVAGNSDTAQAGSAMLFGGQQIIGRSVLRYVREQESAADRAAVEFLNAAHQSAAGMLKVFRYFADQSIGTQNSDPYTRTHPMPQERIARLQEIVRQSPYYDQKDQPQLQLRHDLVRAKLFAYTHIDSSKTVLRQYQDDGLPARYARAIARFHEKDYAAAAPILNELIAAMPQNPWFYELKGTFLLETGNAKDAVAPFRKAVSLVPHSGFLRIELAQAILESEGGKPEEALQMLNKALVDEDQSYLGYRLQSQAFGKLNRFPEADLAAALASFHHGDVEGAQILAGRAKAGLVQGTPAWLRADDIVNFKLEKVRG